MKLTEVHKMIQAAADPERAKFLQRYFKTGPDEYGEGDRFLGLTVPQVRRLAHEVDGLSLNDVLSLLKSMFHEERLLALFLMARMFQKAEEPEREKIVHAYLDHTAYINNWDLVDQSAPVILGAFLQNKPRKILYKLAKSKVLWDRRIAILATGHFIKHEDYSDTMQIAEILLNDQEDLIHKGVGWMLREVGKRNMAAEVDFLNKHYRHMPRTMLRYAVEKFPERLRQAYLKGTV